MMIKSLAAAWLVAAVLAAIDAVWAYAVGISIVGLSDIGDGLRAGLTFAIFFGLIQNVAQRAGYRLITEVCRRAARFFHCASLLFSLSMGFIALSYLAISAHLPLIDSQLSRIDTIVGFNWLTWFDFIESHLWLRTTLVYIYDSTDPAIGATLVYLIVADRVWRYHEMLWIFILTLAATITISGLLPAMHASAYYLLASDRIVPGNFYSYLPDLFALRGGNVLEINLSRPQGIVCFPSFHTIMVIMFCYALRGTRLFWPALVLGAITMLSLPTIGGHYLIDIPGGAAVALIAILVVRRWLPAPPGLRISTGVPAPGPVAATQPPAEAIVSKNHSQI